MKLSNQQLAQIREFISKKGFTYIDVQMEILDHVASQVEEYMTNNPELKFDDALNETHKSFGLLGFSSLEDSITKMLHRRYKKILLSNVVVFFNFKYFPITCLAFFLLYKIQYFTQLTELIYPIFIIVMISLNVVLYVQYFKTYYLKNYLACKSSAIYLSALSVFVCFASAFNDLKTPLFFQNMDINLLFMPTLISLFFIYIFSAIKTARIGIAESKILMQKYKLALR
ncbi:hypothetical protein [Pedobacter jejuensis]|uniref:Uncharacterized protein n=1 Tax=Pedobacter jejuensis TaxID=1268550 RepID=A0A3N0BWU8_9SPHI|nr:hypothetical protein [Pedobacter jejuensis]RNL54108.1 hypothetical protein D7004_08385 [Pedobacter jejuensis]